jgi:hypothetical protein
MAMLLQYMVDISAVDMVVGTVVGITVVDTVADMVMVVGEVVAKLNLF